MITSLGARDKPGGRVRNRLQAARQFVGDAVAQRITVVRQLITKGVLKNEKRKVANKSNVLSYHGK